MAVVLRETQNSDEDLYATELKLFYYKIYGLVESHGSFSNHTFKNHRNPPSDFGRWMGDSDSHLLGWSSYSFFFFFLINLFFYLFIFGCVGSSFLCEGFLQLRRAGATLHRGARASHCCGLSRCGAQAPDAQAQ